MKARRLLVAAAFMAILLTSVLVVSTLSVTTAVAEEDNCTWKCHEATWNADELTCSNNPHNCTACDLVCPEILQPGL